MVMEMGMEMETMMEMVIGIGIVPGMATLIRENVDDNKGDGDVIHSRWN